MSYKFIWRTAFATVVIMLAVFAYGYQQKIELIDRFNPMLATQVGYAKLDAKHPNQLKPITAFTVHNALGDGRELTFLTGVHQPDDVAVVKHKGSYVSQARIVAPKEIPTELKTVLNIK